METRVGKLWRKGVPMVVGREDGESPLLPPKE
jgi:hypothetical protein